MMRRSLRREPPQYFHQAIRSYWPILAGDRHLDDFTRVAPEEHRDLLRHFHARLGHLGKLYVDTFHAVELMDSIYFASRRFPWAKYPITKSDHLEMVWVQYISTCYLYSEKIKKYVEGVHVVGRLAGVDIPLSVSAALKEVRGGLDAQIRLRGRMYHEWTEHRPSLKTLGLVAFMAEIGEPHGGAYADVYRDARDELSKEIGTALDFMNGHLKRITERVHPQVRRTIEVYEACQRELVGRDLVEWAGLRTPKDHEWTR